MLRAALLAVCLICQSYELRLQNTTSAKSRKSSALADVASSLLPCVEAERSSKREEVADPFKPLKVLVLLLLTIKSAVAFSPSSSAFHGGERCEPLSYAVGRNFAHHHGLNIVACSDDQLRVKTFAPREGAAASKSATTFSARIAQLAQLTTEHGCALPSAEHGHDPSLVRWATRQRMLRRQGALAQEIVDDLDAVNFIWDPLQAAWDAKFEELERFFAEHGHANVPSTYAPLPQLASWVGRQRQLYRKGLLPKHRRDAMLALAFEFDPLTARWEERFAEYAAAARAATSSRGDKRRCKVPAESLRQWAARQRKAHAAGKLSLERIEALNQIQGWMWTPPSAQRPSALRRLGLRLAKEISGTDAQDDGISGDSLAKEPAANLCYPRCASVGHALVISVSARREIGASKELEDAREALRSLGYTVVTVENPSASQLRSSFAAHAHLPDWQWHGSSVIALMAHGFDGKVECQDGQTVALADLCGLLAPSETPALRGKPKIFLVQACRQGEQPVISHTASTLPLEPLSLQEATHDPQEVDAAVDKSLESVLEANRQLCEEHDFLWGYASTPGTVAYRGALFSAFRQIVYKHGCETSWLELLQHTNDKLSQWSVHQPSGHGLPSMEIRSTCRGAAFAPADLIDPELAKPDPVYFEGFDE